MLTDETVAALKPGQTLWDGESCLGFGARRQRDAITYVLKFNRGGTQRLATLGRHWQLTTQEARERARALKEGRPPPRQKAAPRTPLEEFRAVVATLPPAPAFKHATLPLEVMQARKYLPMLLTFLAKEEIDREPLILILDALNALAEGRSAALFTPRPKEEPAAPGSPGMRSRALEAMVEHASRVELLVGSGMKIGKALARVSEDGGGVHRVVKLRRWHLRCFARKRAELPDWEEARLKEFATSTAGVSAEDLLAKYEQRVGR